MRTNAFSSILKNNFSRKLIAIFLAATIVPLALISLIFYRINSDTSHEKIMNAILLTDKQVVQQIEARFTQAEKVSDTLQYYMYSFLQNQTASISSRLETFYTLRTNVSTLKSTFDFRHICIFLDTDTIYSNEGLMFYGLDRLEEFHISEEALDQDIAKSVWVYVPNQTYPFMIDKSSEPVDSINCIRALHNASDQSVEFVYFICIDRKEFTELLSSAYENTGITGYLINGDGCTVASSDAGPKQSPSFSEEQLRHIYASERFSDGEALYLPNSLQNGWMYVSRVSNSYIHANTSSYIRIFLLVVVLMILFSVCTVILITKSMTKRITLLSDSASRINFNENQFNASTVDYIESKPEKNYDEVDWLVLTYNKMIRTIYENVNHITELRAQEESLKYRLLQSLINPHFLYNILDSIIACNKIGKTDTANKMIMDLTKFYRMTLRKSNELITIRDELEIARLYMELESICRGGNFSWDISMDDEIENFMICKFTLQPFIENSIQHGMQGFSQKLHIQIDIHYGEDTILIFIIDNGHGISPEKLQELRESLAARQVDTSRHFGICNVNARISSALFGYGTIEIDSTLGEGTMVKIEFQQILP